MNRLYAEDLTGSNPDNAATGQLSTATYPNKFNLVIPPAAPFYRNGMEITDLNGNPLFEGIDYYLALYYADGATASRAAVFGGLMLINGHTDVKYKVQAFGSAYSVPETEIGLFLVNPKLTEPRNLDWSSILRWKIPVPEMGAPESFEEAIETDKIIASIMQLRDLIGDNGEKLDAALDRVINELANVAFRIHNDDLYQHHKTPHQHAYDCDLVGALANDAAAVNAVKIFGRTVTELADILLQSHVSQYVIDRLYDKAGGALNGRLHISGTGELSFVSSSGKQAFRANGQNIVFATDTGTLKFQADSAKNNRGAAVELNAGYNSLLIPSDGAANTLRPIFNGAFIVTEDTVSTYLWAPVQSVANPTFNSTETLRSGGVATQGSPWTLEALPPQATDTKLGLFRLTSSVLLTSPGYALTQKAVTDLRDKLDAYVNESFTINNKAFGAAQSITLTRADLNLGNVDNTEAKDKPVHQRFRDALVNKALKTHTHVAADLLNVPTASAILSGLTFLATDINDTAAKAAVPKMLYDLSLKINEGDDAANNVIPGWVATGTYYGDSGFLPIPTAGRYDGSSQQMDAALRAALGKEENGKYYILRNATSGYAGSEMVLYWTADVSATGALSNPIPTTVEYVPAGLKRIAPNVKFKTTTVIGEDCAIFLGTDNNYYLVMFNGTMDMAKHNRVSRVTLDTLDVGTVNPINPTYFNTNEDRLVLTNGKICLIKMYLQQTDFYTAVWTLNESLVGQSTDVVMTKVPLTGKYPAGDAARFSTYGVNSNDPNTTNWWYITTEGAAKWTSRNLISFSRRNIFAAAKGNKIRVRLHARSSLQSPGIRNSDPQWTVSYVIDLDAKTAVLDDDFFPLCVDETGLTFPKGRYTQTSNNLFYGYTMCLFVQNGIVTGIGNSDAEDFVVRYQLPSADAFESARWDADWSTSVGGSLNVLGPYASAYILRMRGLVALGGTAKKVLLRQRSTGSCMSVAYDTNTTYGVPGYGGWGPSNDRAVVSGTDYEAICRLGQVYDGTQTYLNGASFRKAESLPYKNLAGTTTLTADRVALSDQQWTDVQSFLASKLPNWASTDATMKAAWLSVFDLGGQNLCVLQACFLTANASAGGFDNHTYFYRIPMTFTNGLISLVLASGAEVWKEVNFRLSAVSINELAEMSQMRLIKRNDGWLLRTRTLCRVNTSSSSTDLSYLLRISSDFATWTGTRITFNPSNSEVDYVYLQETDQIARLVFVANGIYLGGVAYDGKGIAFETTSQSVILTGPQVAEGMILYITQQIFFFAGAKEYYVPAGTFDFKQMFPSAYQNNTFYFHVYLDGTTPKYKVSLTREPDSATQLYIGYAKTSSNAIIDTDIQRATRLDNVSALNQHIANKFAHDYLPSGNYAQSIYALMDNLPQLDNAAASVIPTPAQMLSAFTGFSHFATSETQPNNTTEAAAWQFDEPDSFECTVNSTTFTGRMSNYLTGDYDLNFVVTGWGDATYKDNDSGAILLAAFAKGDIDTREHTLSLVFAGSVESHLKLTGRVELIEDYQTPWQRQIAVINADTTAFTDWLTYAQHICVQRRGTVYQLATSCISYTDGANRNDSIRALRRNLSEKTLADVSSVGGYYMYTFDAAIAAPTFAKAKTRWGFGAYSQQFMRFWPINIPTSGNDDSYATSKFVKEVTNQGPSLIADFVPLLASATGTYHWSHPNANGWRMWPKADVSATYTTNVTNNGATGAVALMPPGNVKANKAFRFVLAKQITTLFGSATTVTLKGYVDDSAEVFLNGTSLGTVGPVINLSVTLPANQVSTIGLIVSEAPDNTPCYCGWALITSAGDVVAKSAAGDGYAWMDSTGQLLSPAQATVTSVVLTEMVDNDAVILGTSDKLSETGEYCSPRKQVTGPVASGVRTDTAYVPVASGISYRYFAMKMPKIKIR